MSHLEGFLGGYGGLVRVIFWGYSFFLGGFLGGFLGVPGGVSGGLWRVSGGLWVGSGGFLRGSEGFLGVFLPGYFFGFS